MINLEEDKLESLANVNDAKSLSAQCEASSKRN